MKTLLHARLFAVSAAALLVLACGGRDDDLDDTTHLDSAAGSVAADLSVTEIDLGTHIGADNRLTHETDEFSANDTVYVVVSTTGTATAATLEAKWSFEDGQIVDQSSQTIAPTGPSVTEFHVSKPGGFPKGKYRVEIMLNGNPVGDKEFTVK